MQAKLPDGSVMAAGTVTREAELKYVGEKKTPCASFSIAAGKRKDTTTIFITIKAWSKLALYAANAKKGDAVCAIGRLDSREYNGKTYTDLVCDWLNIAGQSIAAPSAPSAQAEPEADPMFGPDDDDGDLPF